MRLLLDTQILVWMINGDSRLKSVWLDGMFHPDTDLCVSAVIACEYTELLLRRRLPVDEGLAELIDRFALTLLDFPGRGWQLLSTLPAIHRDPVDRMLVAHAIVDGMTLVTADANLWRYPVDCL